VGKQKTMTTTSNEQERLLRTILPYTYVVGQEKLKLALELAYFAPLIGGVLISGKRGTAKSTIARAFARMMYDRLPVTIPINATEDRVVGGWDLKKLLAENLMCEQPGLIEEAHQSLLYVDEVNLLDDHIVNIILDVLSTGKLSIQREGRNTPREISTLFVGTMNPEEGSLRPQLQDRFGLIVQVETDTNNANRLKILQTVLAFDRAVQEEEQNQVSSFLTQGRAEDEKYKKGLVNAQQYFSKVKLLKPTAEACVKLAQACEIEGHRGDYLLALAACAYAARFNEPQALPEHLQAVAELVLRHRLPGAHQLSNARWGKEEEQKVNKILGYA
jgi:magnesium chelatase subunit I